MTLLLLVGCGATWTIPDPLGVADSVPVDSSPPTPQVVAQASSRLRMAGPRFRRSGIW